jgi:putative exosortase-associated protein (TIGR04073 family)
MTLLNRFFVAFLFTGLILVPVSQCSADETEPQFQQPPPAEPTKTYSANVQDKAKHGAINIATGWMEVPKNIIKTTNDTDGNIAFGFVGGGLKGVLETLARTGAGIVDLVTAPIPTKPIAKPQFVWQEFSQDTTYGPVFQLKESRKRNPQDVPVSNGQ